MNQFPENAVAGPSTTRSPRPHSLETPITSSSQALPPPVFLPPPAPIPPASSYLRCTQDLLGRFQLHAAYDKYVRPFAAPHDAGSDALNATPGGALDKGKGKERDPLATSPATMPTPAPDVHDGDDDDGGGGKGEKKKRNNYKHLIKGVPGKHSMKKDDYLITQIQIPPKQHIRIHPFDQRTQRDAFTVSLEGLKGWNPSALIQESAQAREDRKKRKELRRLQKAQQAGTAPVPGLPSTPTPSAQTITQSQSQPIPLSTPIPTNPTASLPPAKQSASNTPRPITATSTPRPGSTIPRPGSTRPPQQPQRVSTSTPISTSPQDAGSGGVGRGGANGYGAMAGNGVVGGGAQMRGTKREREDTGGQSKNGIGVSGADGVNGFGGMGQGTGSVGGYGNGGGSGVNPYIDHVNSSATTPKVIMAANAKAGLPGARPRPIKRQRMDMQGQAIDVTAVQQQPTPQGV